MVRESKLKKGLHIFWALFYDYAAAVRDSFEVFFFQDSNKVRIKLRSEKYPVPFLPISLSLFIYFILVIIVSFSFFDLSIE